MPKYKSPLLGLGDPPTNNAQYPKGLTLEEALAEVDKHYDGSPLIKDALRSAYSTTGDDKKTA